MKKNVKHKFRHKDPEKSLQGPENTKYEVKKEEIPTYISLDLRRVLFSCGIFSTIIIGLYFIQNKTDILDPVFKYFGL